MKKLCVLGAAAGMAAAVAAAPAVKDAFAPATDGAVHLAGHAGESADACIRARAYSDWARGAMYEECVNAFRTHWDDRVGWQNEYWGKTMLCYAGAAMYTGDPALKAWIVEKTHAFLKEFQKPNGYLSTYSKEDFLRKNPEDPDAKKHWCFNIWGRKYTFWALIDIYRATGDKAALDGAVKMADHLIAQLKRLGLTLDKTGAWNGISSMSILRPMLELYHITDNPAYLALAKDIVRAMDAEPANPGRIIRDAFRKEKICTWYPEAAFWAKAYETQSCLEGLVDYYGREARARRRPRLPQTPHGRRAQPDALGRILRPLPRRPPPRERHDRALRRDALDPTQPRAAAPHRRREVRRHHRRGLLQRLPRRRVA